MALVGMASKPLHVRRLQKALRDWVTNPTLFNQPLTSLPVCSIPVYKLPESSPTLLSPREPLGKAPKCAATTATACVDPCKAEPAGGNATGESPLQSSSEPRFWTAGHGTESERSPSPADGGSPLSPRETLEALDTAAVRSVAECVEKLVPGPAKSDLGEVREQLKGNKKLAKMISHILDMEGDDQRREEEIRKYSAIYGRFDSKRRDGKHLTLHELTVNEAAAQLCMKDVALLARRDELFNLARQISREVTYKYTYRTSKSRCGDKNEPSPKRIKAEEGFFDLQEALQAIHMRQESLREQLVQAKSKGEETVGQSIQIQLERLLTRQMEILHDASAQERLQALGWMIPSGAVRNSADKQATNGVPLEPTSDHQAERPLNLHVPGQRQGGAHRDTPLGKQLANELKRHHLTLTGDGKMPSTENGLGNDFFHHVLNLSEKKTIKTEPEDSR